jgi:type IV pilus assembly protein PilW
MAFPSVKGQKGFTLIELVIALSLGSLVILALSILLLQTTSSAHKAYQEVRLQTQLSQFRKLIVGEIRRSGYQINRESSTHFSGEESLVYVSQNKTILGVVYQVEASGAQAFRNVVLIYSVSEKMLRLCEKYSASPLTTEDALISTRSAPCYAMFDPRQFSVVDFKVTGLPLRTLSYSSGVIAVRITLSQMADPEIKQTRLFKITQRNGG